MELFTNEKILSWLDYFTKDSDLEIAKIKIIDITRKNKNLIPTVESHRATLVLTDAGHPDIFYTMWDAGLGNCEILYNDGADPVGPIHRDKLREMINRGINASAGMLVLNPNARGAYQIGMDNQRFSAGSIHYVGSEIRAIIMNKLSLGAGDNLCIVSGASIAVEAAMIAVEGSVIAVERKAADRATMEENVAKFGLQNVTTVAGMDALDGLPVPDIGFVVASSHLAEDIAALTARNPKIRLVVYMLDLPSLTAMPAILAQCGLKHVETVQVSVSKLNSKNVFEAQPAPWIVTAQAE